jgi:hypothetical protein
MGFKPIEADGLILSAAFLERSVGDVTALTTSGLRLFAEQRRIHD